MIDSFGLSIGLGVVSGREGEIVVKESSQFLSKGRCELGTSVGDYFVIETKTKEDFVEEEVGDSFCGDSFLGRAKNHPLSKPMVDHNKK